MKRVCIFLLVLFLCNSIALGENNRVIDNTGSLTTSEAATIEKTIHAIQDNYGFDVVLLMEHNIGDQVPKIYAADFYDNGGFGYGVKHDGIMLLLVTGGEVGNRDYCIVNTGRSINIFTDNVVNIIEDDILPFLRASDYYTALRCFTNDIKLVLESTRRIDSPNSHDDSGFNINIHLDIDLNLNP